MSQTPYAMNNPASEILFAKVPTDRGKSVQLINERHLGWLCQCMVSGARVSGAETELPVLSATAAMLVY